MQLLKYSGVRIASRIKAASKRGFTLTEMLVTMLILVLASTLMATGIPAAIDTYQKVVKTSNAQLALSTTISVMQAELGLATKVEVKQVAVSEEESAGEPEGDSAEESTTNKRIYYYSSSEGCWAYIGNDTGEGATSRGLVKQYLKGMPTLTTPVDQLEPDGPSAPLVSNEAITDRLKVALVDAERPELTEELSLTEVDVSLEVVDIANNRLASVGVDGPEYRILTRFANEG